MIFRGSGAGELACAREAGSAHPVVLGFSASPVLEIARHGWKAGRRPPLRCEEHAMLGAAGRLPHRSRPAHRPCRRPIRRGSPSRSEVFQTPERSGCRRGSSARRGQVPCAGVGALQLRAAWHCAERMATGRDERDGTAAESHAFIGTFDYPITRLPITITRSWPLLGRGESDLHGCGVSA